MATKFMRFEDIPDTMLMHILSYCSFREFFAISRLGKYFYRKYNSYIFPTIRTVVESSMHKLYPNLTIEIMESIPSSLPYKCYLSGMFLWRILLCEEETKDSKATFVFEYDDALWTLEQV